MGGKLLQGSSAAALRPRPDDQQQTPLTLALEPVNTRFAVLGSVAVAGELSGLEPVFEVALKELSGTSDEAASAMSDSEPATIPDVVIALFEDGHRRGSADSLGHLRGKCVLSVSGDGTFQMSSHCSALGGGGAGEEQGRQHAGFGGGGFGASSSGAGFGAAGASTGGFGAPAGSAPAAGAGFGFGAAAGRLAHFRHLGHALNSTACFRPESA